MRRTTLLLLAMAIASASSVVWAQNAPIGLIPVPFPKSTPGYAQLVDAKTKAPIEWHKIVFNQIDRICLRHGASISAIEKLAKAEGWTVVGVDSWLNQFVLNANGAPINRSKAWEFSVGPQRYFVAVTPQPSFSLALGAARPSSRNINKCEIKVVSTGVESRFGLKAVLRTNGWSVIASPQRGIEIFGVKSSDREITIFEDYNKGAVPIEVIVM